MSSQFTTEQIQERFASLPDDMKAVISGEETAQQIQEIGRRHGLRIDNIGILIEYSGLIMLGLIKTNEFVSSLQNQMGISTEQAEQLAIEVDSQVFSRMRSSLRQAQYQSTADKRFTAQKTVSQAPSSAQTNSVIDTQIPAPNTVVDTAPVDVPVQTSVSDAMAADVSKDVIPDDLQAMMSGGDYNPNEFEVTASPSAAAHHAPEEITTPVEPPKVGGDIDMSAFEADTPTIHSSVTAPVDVSIQTPNQVAHDEYAQNERQAQNAVAQDVVGSMPGVVGDVYKEKLANSTAATPAPATDAVKIQDFRSRLQEKMSTQDNTAQNADPYRESIS